MIVQNGSCRYGVAQYSAILVRSVLCNYLETKACWKGSLVSWWHRPDVQECADVLITVQCSEYNAKHGEWCRWLIRFACRF